MSSAENKRLPTNEEEQREIATEGNKTPDSARYSPGAAAGAQDRGHSGEMDRSTGKAPEAPSGSGGKSKHDPKLQAGTGKYDSKVANSFDVAQAAVPNQQAAQTQPEGGPDAVWPKPGEQDDGGESLLEGTPREAHGERGPVPPG